MGFLEIFTQIPTAAYILFAAGVILAAVELCIPGFGICGAGSALCFIAAVIVGARTFAAGVVFAAIILAVVAALIVVFSILASRGKFIKPLVLRDELGTQEGFSSSRNFEFLKGEQGVSQSILRPAGRAQINGHTYDVVTTGDFVAPDTPVEVVEVSGSRIVVRKTGA